MYFECIIIITYLELGIKSEVQLSYKKRKLRIGGTYGKNNIY